MIIFWRYISLVTFIPFREFLGNIFEIIIEFDIFYSQAPDTLSTAGHSAVPTPPDRGLAHWDTYVTNLCVPVFTKDG
jgi:hypothetical protein